MRWLTEFLPSLLLLFLPIVAANQAGMVAQWQKLPGAFRPISKHWLGKNKTWAPYYMAPLIALAILIVITLRIPHTVQSVFDLRTGKDLLLVGMSLGMGAVLGDHIKSFIKRRLGYPSGLAWMPDRFDFALGGGVAAWLVIPRVGWMDILGLVVLALPVHYVGNYVGYQLGWRQTPH